MTLLSGNADLSTAILVCVGIMAAAFIIGYIYATAYDTKNTIDKGGIKGIYPNIIKFIMQNYPNARVTTDTKILMRIESIDTDLDVTMKFSLWLNTSNNNLKVTGTIIPGNTKWAWMPSEEFQWIVESKYGSSYSEMKVIERIKNEMVFEPSE